MFFKNVDFAQGIRSKWRVPLCAMFLKIPDFSRFLKILFVGGSRGHCVRFWSVLGTSKIDPDPSKVMFLLKREHRFQIIVPGSGVLETPDRFLHSRCNGLVGHLGDSQAPPAGDQTRRVCQSAKTMS